MKNYGEGHIRAVYTKASREESGNGSGIRYGSLRITSPVPPLSGTLRGSEEKATQAILEAECARRARQEKYHLVRGRENCQK